MCVVVSKTQIMYNGVKGLCNVACSSGYTDNAELCKVHVKCSQSNHIHR